MSVRIRLRLEDDIAEQLSKIAKVKNQPFNQVVNEAIRVGLAGRSTSIQPFDYEGYLLGLLPGIDEHRLNELAWQLDDDRYREQ